MITLFKILRGWKEIIDLIREFAKTLEDKKISPEEAIALVKKAVALFQKIGVIAN